MIDSIKLAVPVTWAQHIRIKQAAEDLDKGQWVIFFQRTGEMLFRRTNGIARTDSESFHRELRWSIPSDYDNGCCLMIEFSVPKFWYGQNIRLLYDFMPALNRIRELLNQAFGLRTKGVLPNVEQWSVYRLDVCYAWKFPDQDSVKLYMDSLKHLRFPRKTPIIYPDGLQFNGTTYSVKFYLKYPEFRKHDMTAMIDSGASLDYVNYLEGLAIGVIRFEVLLRRQWLKRNGINTVADLLKPDTYLEWDEEIVFPKDFDEDRAILAVLEWEMYENGFNPNHVLDLDRHSEIDDGTYLSAPKGIYDIADVDVHYPGGGFTFRKQNRMQSILQNMLYKFIGKETLMLEPNQVQTKLLALYKPNKASRLTGFWLYVQEFGLERALEYFGKDSYYDARADLKAAGVSLAEKPKSRIPENVEFIEHFRMRIPSAHVVNREDDFREGENVLNLFSKASNM